MIKTLKNI